jgi:hypothetical protein
MARSGLITTPNKPVFKGWKKTVSSATYTELAASLQPPDKSPLWPVSSGFGEQDCSSPPGFAVFAG